MSGHSHWSKVKRAKAVTDSRRGREWSKLARRVIVAARAGGGKPEENLTLRYAIDECRAANMPNDTIDRAVKKGTGELGETNYESVQYEGYGPGGVAFLVDCLTDNRNRTAPEMRKIFERGGGQLGGSNCVSWMFEQKGKFIVLADKTDEDTLMELAVDAGADDVSKQDDFFEITCQPAAFAGVRAALADRKIPVESAQLAMIPTNTIPVGAEKASQVLSLLESLEDHDDVQNVYANFDIPADVMESIQNQK